MMMASHGFVRTIQSWINALHNPKLHIAGVKNLEHVSNEQG